MNLYELLGVAPDATKDDIKLAYQRLAQTNHPDKGGDAERFQEIRRAFDVLYNDAKRAEYDETGEVSEENDDRPNMLASLSKLLIDVLDRSSGDNDPINEMVLHISAKKGQYQSAIATATRLIAKRNKVVNRIIKKDGGENILVSAIKKDIAFLEQTIVNANKGIDDCDKMIALVNEYEFESVRALPPVYDVAQQNSDNHFNGRWFGGIHP